MNDRETLIELMEQAYYCSIEQLADHLIANGVVVRERGENVKKEYPSLFECSKCGWSDMDTYTGDTSVYNFCPNCGADMRRERTMAKCKDCLHMELCARDERLPDFAPEQEALCQFFVDRSRYMVREKPQTNADRIRAMSDEELAVHLHDIGWDCNLCSENERLSDNPMLCNERCDEKCAEHCLDWLKQPVKDGESGGDNR